MIVPDVELVVEGATGSHTDKVAEEHGQDEELGLDVEPSVHLDQVTVARQEPADTGTGIRSWRVVRGLGT